MNQKQQPKNWRKMKLREVATLHRGYDLPIDKIKEGKNPVIFSNGKIEYHNEYKIKGPGVVTGRSGTLGNTFYIEKDFWPHNTTLYVSNFHNNSPKFIYFLFKQLKLERFNAGSGVPTLNRNHVHEIFVNIPESTGEQKKIASVLSGFDNKIELNNKINKILEQMAQAIFKEWFVNFKFPGYEKVKMVNSELGKIPEGWKIKKIKDIVNIKSGYSFKSEDFISNGKYNLVTIKNVQDGEFKTKCENQLELIPEKTPDYCLLKNGDILLSLTGNIGRICIFHGNDYLLNQRVAKLEPKEKRLKGFIYLLFRNTVIKSQMEALAGGSAQQNLSPIETSQIKISIPDNKIFDNFIDLTNSIFENILSLKLENQKLITLRDLLFPKLMSGEIRV